MELVGHKAARCLSYGGPTTWTALGIVSRSVWELCPSGSQVQLRQEQAGD